MLQKDPGGQGVMDRLFVTFTKAVSMLWGSRSQSEICFVWGGPEGSWQLLSP